MSSAAATISTSCASTISAIRLRRSKAFKAGDLDWRVEYSAKTWATGYDFPALTEGRVGAGKS